MTVVVRSFLITSDEEKSRLLRGVTTRSSLGLGEEMRGDAWRSEESFRMRER
jgi:hypothetical protein